MAPYPTLKQLKGKQVKGTTLNKQKLSQTIGYRKGSHANPCAVKLFEKIEKNEKRLTTLRASVVKQKFNNIFYLTFNSTFFAESELFAATKASQMDTRQRYFYGSLFFRILQ